jgi:serine/threonine protein kinase
MASSDEIRGELERSGKFSIHKEIEEGANAVVFRAFDLLLQRDVFLKVIYYGPEAASVLLREPRILVQATQCLPKPENLVQVYGADIITIAGDEHLCLQMELVEGSSFVSSLASNEVGQMDALRITRGILHGVSHLHSRRILHRDLKPANILLHGATPKIADFGSVAVLPEGATAVPASKHSALYVPPEGWRACPSYSMASDIYQVGMLLYELINGPLESQLRHYLTPAVLRGLRVVGRNFDTLDDCDKSQQGDRGISELCSKGRLLMHGRPARPYYSTKLRRIVNVATNPNPNERYAGAQEFIAKLNQIEIPNWREITSCEFLATNWRGWDWMVAMRTNEAIVSKARPGSSKFRRVPNGVMPSLAASFSYIELQ